MIRNAGLRLNARERRPRHRRATAPGAQQPGGWRVGAGTARAPRPTGRAGIAVGVADIVAGRPFGSEAPRDMPSLLRRAYRRAAATVDRVAAGSQPPAGQDPPAPGSERRPSTRERGVMRRRLRELRHRREALLLELGALVFELHRHGRQESELVASRAEAIATLDEEARALATALDTEVTLVEVVQAGIAARCGNCSALVASGDRFCSNCGTPADLPGRPRATTPAATAQAER